MAARTPRYGRISRAEFERRAAFVRGSTMTPHEKRCHIEALELLTGDPAAGRAQTAAAAGGSDQDLEAEFPGAFPPSREARQRQHIAAAARVAELSEDELFEALFPPGKVPPR